MMSFGRFYAIGEAVRGRKLVKPPWAVTFATTHNEGRKDILAKQRIISFQDKATAIYYRWTSAKRLTNDSSALLFSYH